MDVVGSNEPQERGSSRRGIVPAVLAVALVAAAAAVLAIGARGSAPAQTMQQRVRAVASQLRCPVCQDLSVADAPSPLAAAMRARIASELRAGQSPAAVRAEFVRAYGIWILMAPPRHGLSMVVWILPLLLALGGCVLAAVAVRRWTREGASLRAADPGASSGAGEDHIAADDLTPSDRRLLARAISASVRSGGEGS